MLGVYLALAQTIDAEPLDPMTVGKFTRTADGTIVYRTGEQFQAADLASVQKAVNFAALETLRNYSIVALVIMFALSLIIGWWVAGRTLRPIGEDHETTREITATDLSRRIDDRRTAGRAAHADRHDQRHARAARHRIPCGTSVRRGRLARAAQPGCGRPGQRRGRAGNEASTPAERRDATAS